MDAAREKLIDRIMKLLALASGTTFEGEADNARRLAQELLDKHNINLGSVASPTDRTAIVIQKYMPQFKGAIWEYRMADAAAKLCGCMSYYRGDYVMFEIVGTRADIEPALYIVTKLHEQRIGQWLRYKRTAGGDSFHKFCYGYSQGVADKIAAITDPMTELKKTRKTAELWYESKFKVGEGHSYGQASSSAGLTAGGSASFHRGEFGTGQRKLLR